MATKNAGALGIPKKQREIEDKDFPGKKNPSMPEEYEEQLDDKLRMVPQPFKKSNQKQKKKK